MLTPAASSTFQSTPVNEPFHLGGGFSNEGGRLVLSKLVIRGNRDFMGGRLLDDGSMALSGETVKGNCALVGRNLFSTTRATLHWRRAPVARQARSRLFLASQERTSWVASK